MMLSETIVTERSRSCNAPLKNLSELQAPARAEMEVPTTAVRLKIDHSGFTTKVNGYEEPVVLESEQEKRLLDTLSTVEMAELLRGSHPTENGGFR